MSQENYCQEIFNQQLIIEASGHVVGLPGKVAYSLLASTKDGVKYNQTLAEGSGLSRVYAEKTLQKDVIRAFIRREIIHFLNFTDTFLYKTI